MMKWDAKACLLRQRQYTAIYLDYLHRVGRTARIGKNGEAISFVNELDIEILEVIKNRTSSFERCEFEPKEKDILQVLNTVAAAKRKVFLMLHDNKFGHKQDINRRKTSNGPIL